LGLGRLAPWMGLGLGMASTLVELGRRLRRLLWLRRLGLVNNPLQIFYFLFFILCYFLF
jgi:hypothetical protein